MQIKSLPINQIKAYENNPRMNDDAVLEVKKSISEFGFQQPLVIDKNKEIIVGHTRMRAATELGFAEVPCVVADDLTEEQVKAYRIMDNKSAEFSQWNYGLLTKEMTDLLESDYDLSLTGFSGDELSSLDLFLETAFVEDGMTDEDDVPETPLEPVSKLGDLWALGNHRLLCGDSTSIDAVDILMDGNKPDMVFTDPPYGINYQDLQKNHKKIKNDESLTNIRDLLSITLGFDCPLYICCNWKCFSTFEDCMSEYGKYPKSCIIWDKKVRVQNLDKFFKQHEFILYYGEFGGQPTIDGDIWRCDREVRKDHPTAKPVSLCERAIEHSSKSNNTVTDLFLGSGSTLIASEKRKRRCFGMELDPKYCDVIIERWQNYTGKNAIHQESQKLFNEMQQNTVNGE